MFKRKNQKVIDDEDAYFFEEEEPESKEKEEKSELDNEVTDLGIDQEELQSYYQEFHRAFNEEMRRLKEGEKAGEDEENNGEVDPLDAFMAENDEEYFKDMTDAVVKTQAERKKIINGEDDFEDTRGDFVEEEEPLVDYVDEMSKRKLKDLENKCTFIFTILIIFFKRNSLIFFIKLRMTLWTQMGK